ncbi:hypothetical protein N7540_012313 [Penicillium herquei]|nr:hypothetical protein N7540_012313 [Penicillium herquei]
MGSRLEENSDAMLPLSNQNRDIDEFHDETGEEYEASSFGGFADYMRRKKLKLQNLDAEIRATSGDCPQIFRGIVAHVNGYTQPSLQDLHRLIVSHGGGFLQYLDGKTAATHIIASALTPKKCEEFRRYRIVKPAWVTESIKAGRLLPWNDFRVVDESQSQKVLKFVGGRISSQASTPRSGYKDQSSTSWYNTQLQATGAGTTSDERTRNHTTPSKQTPSTPTLPLQSPRSSKRHPSTSPVANDSKAAHSTEPQSTRSHIMKTPSKTTHVAPNEDPDELESPRKDESARIQVDPVLSNSAHKPLNLSGSQFIMPPAPEPKSTPAPMGDIRSKLAAQAKPRDNSHSGFPCPTPEAPDAYSDRRENIPAHPDLDPETLAALPEDIRKEVLAHYSQMSAKSESTSPPAPPPSSTPVRPSPSQIAGSKRSASPLRKPSRVSKSGMGSTRTLMQLGFVSRQPTTSTPDIHTTRKESSPTVSAIQPQPSLPVSISNEQSSHPENLGKDANENKPDTSDRPVFTSKGLSNIDDLRDAISAWHSAFTIDGPYKDDVEALCTYLRRVTTEEKDVDKAVSVVRWLMWLVDQDSRHEENYSKSQVDEDVITWSDAIQTMQSSVQSALEARGLPVVKFE